ncbi:STAS domain-containing protein [Nonomuraea insulae]|uniref:Anti-sigma factor antagonist n=1 Tax=Nonomuraea insulae TaxID=1616787 RepID=A0ABW1DDJ3_9ACTN
MSPISLDCRPLRGGVLITVAGDIDATNAGHVETCIDRMRRPGQAVLLDLSGLRFMDSRGLHVLLRAHGDIRKQGGTMHLAAVADTPAHVLRITGVWDALTIHPSVEEAITAIHSRLDNLGDLA